MWTSIVKQNPYSVLKNNEIWYWLSFCLYISTISETIFKKVTNLRWYHKGLSLNIGKACACVVMCVCLFFLQPNKNLNTGLVNVNCFGNSFTFENNFMKALDSHRAAIGAVCPWADWVQTCLSLVRHQSKAHLSRQPAVQKQTAPVSLWRHWLADMWDGTSYSSLTPHSFLCLQKRSSFISSVTPFLFLHFLWLCSCTYSLWVTLSLHSFKCQKDAILENGHWSLIILRD